MSKRRSGRKPQGGATVKSGGDFWGDGKKAPADGPGPADASARRIRPTPDPGAMPRSLGDPPLAASTMAQHHLAAVYQEAVRAAVALAGANGLLDGTDVTAGTDGSAAEAEGADGAEAVG